MSGIMYMRTDTGEITYVHREAVEWFRIGATIELYLRQKKVCAWEH